MATLQVNCHILGEQPEEAVSLRIPKTAIIYKLRSAIKSDLFSGAAASGIHLCTVPERHDFSTSSKTLPLPNLHGLLSVREVFKNLNERGVVHALIEPPAGK